MRARKFSVTRTCNGAFTHPILSVRTSTGGSGNSFTDPKHLFGKLCNLFHKCSLISTVVCWCSQQILCDESVECKMKRCTYSRQKLELYLVCKDHEHSPMQILLQIVTTQVIHLHLFNFGLQSRYDAAAAVRTTTKKRTRERSTDLDINHLIIQQLLKVFVPRLHILLQRFDTCCECAYAPFIPTIPQQKYNGLSNGMFFL